MAARFFYPCNERLSRIFHCTTDKAIGKTPNILPALLTLPALFRHRTFRARGVELLSSSGFARLAATKLEPFFAESPRLSSPLRTALKSEVSTRHKEIVGAQTEYIHKVWLLAVNLIC